MSREQLDIFDRTGIPRHQLLCGGLTEHNAVVRAILGHTDETLALAQVANEILSTRDNRALRFLIALMHRGDPTAEGIERSPRRHHERLKLPPLEAAADTLIERLDELASRLERLGRGNKGANCRRAIGEVQAAVGGGVSA